MALNLVDGLIIILLLASIVRGAGSGFMRQFFSLSGFVGGLLLGAALAPWLSHPVTDPLLRQLTVLGTVLVSATLLSGAGEYLGHRLAMTVARLRGGPVDGLLGAIFGGVLALVSVWLITGILVGTPWRGLNQLLSGSQIIRQLDAHLPPAPPVVARLESLINPNGFPRVFTGLEPAPPGPVGTATPAEVAAAVRADQASTVKIEGVGCGGLVSGSGFVAAPGLVITNAHVVAGIANPVVIDANGRHTATPVSFDPRLDVAVLRVAGLAGPPLKLQGQQLPGTAHVVALGYPGGGPFTAAAAGVIDARLALGRDIYNSGLTSREIYELQAVVRPGNSGGPLVLPDGTVVGVVFARSQTNPDLGYALTLGPVLNRLQQAEQSNAAVGTGAACAAG